MKYFTSGSGVKSELELEAMLAYWLSWYVFASGPEDGLNHYVFFLAVILGRGQKLALAPIILGSLFCRLDDLHREFVKVDGANRGFLC